MMFDVRFVKGSDLTVLIDSAFQSLRPEWLSTILSVSAFTLSLVRLLSSPDLDRCTAATFRFQFSLKQMLNV
jgi:hypothetical protein